MSIREEEPLAVVETIDHVVTFRARPYERTYDVDGFGKVYRPGDTTPLDRLIFKVSTSDTSSGIEVAVTFVSQTSAKLTDGFTKTSGQCPDNAAVGMARTIVVKFAVPPVTSTETCEWSGTALVGEPLVKVVVQTLRVP